MSSPVTVIAFSSPHQWPFGTSGHPKFLLEALRTNLSFFFLWMCFRLWGRMRSLANFPAWWPSSCGNLHHGAICSAANTLVWYVQWMNGNIEVPVVTRPMWIDSTQLQCEMCVCQVSSGDRSMAQLLGRAGATSQIKSWIHAIYNYIVKQCWCQYR